jgi:hypothetical protein
MIYLLIITDSNGYQHTEPTRYEFRMQAEMHGKEWERKAPGVRWEVRQVDGLLSRLDTQEGK